MIQPLVLVVGATGQLGAVVVRKLCARGQKVRALVRPDSDVRHLSAFAVEMATGDLCDSHSLQSACKDVDCVIATANAAMPRKSTDKFKSVDDKGYRDLIDAARNNGVRQFIYTSVIRSQRSNIVPIFRLKESTEQYLIASGLNYTVIRAAAFMDISFAMLGSDIPIRGAVLPTVERPFWFTRSFFKKVRGDIARGKVSVPGNGTARHSFIAIDDVAEYLVRSVDAPSARNRIFDTGGPEPLSLLEIVKVYEKILEKTLKVSTTPAFVFRLMRTFLAPFSPAAANIMALNFYIATQDGIALKAVETAAHFGMRLTTAEEFLTRRQQSPGMEAH